VNKLVIGLVVIGLLAASAGWVAVSPLQAAQDVYNLSGDWIRHVEDALTRSANTGGTSHGRQEDIRRYIQDIGYFLHEAGKAAQREDRLAVEHNTKQALELLHRSVRKGYFRPEEVERILTLIKRHLPGVAI
jgi:hypothetical protein